MDQHFEKFMEAISEFDIGFDLVTQYDQVPHKYGHETLFQSEMALLKIVGQKPNITVTAIAQVFCKSKSACSQMVHKLRNKGLLEQTRNEENLREYNLHLTDTGWEIYNLHSKFESNCMKRSFSYLKDFSNEDFQTYIQIQRRMNDAFRQDVEDNLELYQRVINLP